MQAKIQNPMVANKKKQKMKDFPKMSFKEKQFEDFTRKKSNIHF